MIERFVARNSPVRMLFFLVLSLGLAVLGAWVAGLFGPAPEPGMAWAGWICLAVFGLGALSMVPRLFNRGEQIAVDHQGVYWAQWSERTIPWLAIRAVERRTVQKESYLCLTLDDPSRHPPDGMFGALSRPRRWFGMGDIAIGVRGTDRSLDELADAIARFSPKGPRAPDLRLEG